LIGPLPEAAGQYQKWSPVFHAQKIRRPLLIFQGDSDPVVPPQYTQELVDALKRERVPVTYQVYSGEGHGFRKSESRIDQLERIQKFMLNTVLFSA